MSAARDFRPRPADVREPPSAHGARFYDRLCANLYAKCAARLSAYLTVSAHDIFVRAQLTQTERSARVELLGGDSDFRAEAEFESVGEAARHIPIDGRRIDTREKTLRVRCVLGYDHFGVSGGVASDVLHRLSDRGAGV